MCLRERDGEREKKSEGLCVRKRESVSASVCERVCERENERERGPRQEGDRVSCT